jgi:hypothetical protein
MPKTPEYTEGPEALANFKQFATAILQAPGGWPNLALPRQRLPHS